MSELLIYGSYGYVGELIAREAVDRDIEVILAGRDGDRVQAQVEDMEQPGRRFELDDPSVVAEAVADVDCVLNCAGPFSNTAVPLVEGCLESGTDYVDIAGEIPVLERIQERDAAAVDAGVTLLPAAGFSSVPMDCLAAHLAERLPEATHLSLGADTFRVPSVGTLEAVIEGADTGSAVRRDGEIEEVPAGSGTRRIDFGRGTLPAVPMPLGDVSTAYVTTGIPNVAVYAAMPQPARLALKAHRFAEPAFATRPVQWTLKRLASLVREGPSERARERGSVYVWGEARTDDETVVSRLETPDAYVVTVQGGVTTAERVLAGDANDGYQTPAGAFGPEFVFEIEGVEGFYDEERPTDYSSPVVDVLTG